MGQGLIVALGARGGLDGVAGWPRGRGTGSGAGRDPERRNDVKQKTKARRRSGKRCLIVFTKVR